MKKQVVVLSAVIFPNPELLYCFRSIKEMAFALNTGGCVVFQQAQTKRKVEADTWKQWDGFMGH